MGIRVKDTIERIIRYMMYKGTEIKAVYSGAEKVYVQQRKEVYVNKGVEQCEDNLWCTVSSSDKGDVFWVVGVETKVNDLVYSKDEYSGVASGECIIISNSRILEVQVSYNGEHGVYSKVRICIIQNDAAMEALIFDKTVEMPEPVLIDNIEWDVERFRYYIKITPII